MLHPHPSSWFGGVLPVVALLLSSAGVLSLPQRNV
jgi:hypothetical protein